MTIEAATNTETNDNQIHIDDLSTDVIGEAYGEASKKLVNFVSKNLELMKDHLLRTKFPSFTEINQAYFDYLPVSFMLNDLYQKVRADERKAQEEYNLFDDQAMHAIKTELNREDNKKTWYSATELKNAAHTKYKHTYATLSAKVTLAEGRRSFVERLCKSWDTWQFGLGQISRNMIAEANANGLDLKAQSALPPDPDDYKTPEFLASEAMRVR